MKRTNVLLMIFIAFLCLGFSQQTDQVNDGKAIIEKQINNWCSEYPTTHISLNALAYYCFQEQDFGKVVSILGDKIKEGFVDDLEKCTTYFLLGLSLESIKDIEKAKDALVQAKEAAQALESTEIYESIGRLLTIMTGSLAEATNNDKIQEQIVNYIISKENAINSNDPILAFAKGQQSEDFRNIGDAASSANTIAYNFYLGKKALDKGNLEEAVTRYNFVISNGYSPADIVFDLADIYISLGKNTEAISILEDYLKGNPSIGLECANKLIDLAMSRSEEGSQTQQEPQGGSQEPQGGSQEPQGGSQEPQGGSQEPQGGSQEPQGGSQEPQGGSQEPQGGSQEPQGGSQEPQGGLHQEPQGGPHQEPQGPQEEYSK